MPGEPPGGLRAVFVRAKEGKPSNIAHSGSHSTSPGGEPAGEGVGAPSEGVVYMVAAVITVESTVGGIEPGEALGAVLSGLGFGNLRVEPDLSSVNSGSETKKRSL